MTLKKATHLIGALMFSLLSGTIASTGFADSSAIDGTIEFDRSRLYDCYNAGEIVFFRDGRMTYNGDDFTIIEPERWMSSEGKILPGQEVGVRFTRVEIESAPMFIQSFDAQGRILQFDQKKMPEAGDEVMLTVSDSSLAFSIEFDHDTAGLDVTFELFDPANPVNASAMNFGLNCS